ncbi:MAG TPA: hypothetical protein VK673_21755 [Chthoniobacterales bacterium]|nr:hypothetical protein [Chthoniobacterales bacterium]
MAYNQAAALTLVFGNVQGGVIGSSSPVAAPGNFQTFQIISPWGQTQAALVWEEAWNQLFRSGQPYGNIDVGRLGNYLDLGVVNGPTPTPFNYSYNGTFTLTSATITSVSGIGGTTVAGLTPGMLVFCSAAGLVGLCYIVSIPSANSITLNQTFGGTTGSYTFYVVPCPSSGANDIISTP